MSIESRKKTRRPRTRRKPEESRDLILSAAEQRLAEHGLEGLNIADVARQAGLSHGTLLHHFGSSEGMRRALVARMAERMLDEVLELEGGVEPNQAGMAGFFERLFAQLSSGGHARLIAWLALTHSPGADGSAVVAATAERLDHLVSHIAQRLSRGGNTADADRSARYIVLLVISSAIGLGVARDSLLPQLALSVRDEGRYAGWLARVIGERLRPR